MRVCTHRNGILERGLDGHEVTVVLILLHLLRSILLRLQALGSATGSRAATGPKKPNLSGILEEQGVAVRIELGQEKSVIAPPAQFYFEIDSEELEIALSCACIQTHGTDVQNGLITCCS